jgi:hypothetical protein
MTSNAKRLRLIIAPFFFVLALPPIALAIVLTGCQVLRSVTDAPDAGVVQEAGQHAGR